MESVFEIFMLNNPIEYLSLIIALISLLLMLYIARKQHKLTKSIDEKLLTSLPSQDDVYIQLLKLLEESIDNKRSLFIMVYWVWIFSDIERLGNKRKLSKQDFIDLNSNDSRITQFILKRIVDTELETHIVVSDPQEDKSGFNEFIYSLLNWHDIEESDINEVFSILTSKYKNWFEVFRAKVNDNPNVHLYPAKKALPNLLCSARQSGMILFLLETPDLYLKVQMGGFWSAQIDSINMVAQYVYNFGIKSQ